MNKIYALAPLAGLLLFGGFYWKHSIRHTERLAEIQRLADQAKQEKREREEAASATARAQAAVALAERKREREEKERVEALQKQARLDLEQRRNAASDRARKLRPQVDRLRVEIDAAHAGIARHEERKRELLHEQAFLGGYVQQADANRNAFYQLLEKLEAIDRARAAESANPRHAGAGRS
jgi:hypothetical protein